MNNKLYMIFGALIILVCCSAQEREYPEQVVIASPPPPMYPCNGFMPATILKKRTLPHKREEYHARFESGREINFTIEGPNAYQVGDKIILPLE